MLRICTCLLFVFASLAVAQAGAREVNKLSPNDSCNTSAARRDAPARDNLDGTPREAAAASGPAAARGTKAKPSMHSDSDSSNRLQSPRWHNFLPGMFR